MTSPHRPLVVCVLLVGALAAPVAAQAPPSPWAAAIDAHWGPGPPPEEQLHAFDEFWRFADSSFAAFHHVPADWDALRARYRPELAAGASRGRFAAILNHLALALREPHTFALDSLVNVATVPGPGVPLLYGAVRGNNRHFGACLTPLPDRTLLVYDAVPGHPLGLAPGDVVLGYDGERWADLYPRLLAAELPLVFWSDPHPEHPPWARSMWGSAPSAWAAGWLTAAGMNWHLFTTLDVVRRATGETVHLPVAPLAGQPTPILCTEQLPVPGVPSPSPPDDRYVSWGRVAGTNVGYVYVWSWLRGAPYVLFRQAIQELAFGDDPVEGLIVDFRFNHGGIVSSADAGFALLFDRTIETLDGLRRTDPDDRYALELFPVIHATIRGAPATFFGGPIAILTGPGAYSAGDYNAIRLGFHPRARVFGRSTSASFGAADHVGLGAGRLGAVSFLNTRFHDGPQAPLIHTEQRVDEAVWMTAEGVARGEDTTVRRALDWIATTVSTEAGPVTSRLALSENAPNPFSETTALTLTLARGGHATVALYDIVGRRVATLHDGALSAGPHRLTVSADGLASGVYALVATTEAGATRRVMTVAR